MTKTPKSEITKRDVGEKVSLALGLESASTKDLGDGVLEAIITTSAVDRQNENIETTGIDTKTFMDTGGPVLWGHDYEGLPIGRATKLTKQMGSQIKARFELAINEYPFAATVYAMIKGGFINSVSIGGIVREWSDDYRTIKKMEMVEFSIVSVPANAQAIITSRSLEKATGKSMDTIKQEFQDFSRSVLLDKVSDLGDDEVNQSIKTLKNLVDILEESAKTNSKQVSNKTTKRVMRYTLADSAKSVATQAHRVIKIVKLKEKEDENE